MKTIILVWSLPLFFVSAIHAQVEVGAKIGLGFSTISGNGIRSGLQPGFEAGAFVNFGTSNKWSFRPELLLSINNSKRSSEFFKYYVESASSNTNNDIQTSYINIPLLVGYKASERLTLHLGPQIGFLVYRSDNLLKYDQNPFKNVDGGLAADAQLNLGNLQLYARYYRGLLNVNDIDDRYTWHYTQLSFGLAVSIFNVGAKRK